jgi:hypothetical protein
MPTDPKYGIKVETPIKNTVADGAKYPIDPILLLRCPCVGLLTFMLNSL